MSALAKEMETYERELYGLLSHKGKYVLIFDSKVEGIFAAYEDALNAGYEKFGLNPFLVKQIEAVEQVHCFSRDVTCHT